MYSKFSFGEVYRRITVGNLVLFTRERSRKHDFRPYIRRYTSRNENFKNGYPHSNVPLQSRRKLERCKPHKAPRLQMKCG